LLPLREAAPGFDSCTARAREFEKRLLRWRDAGDTGASANVAEADPLGIDTRPIDQDHADIPAADPDDRGPLLDGSEPSVLWYELTARGFRLSRTPLDVAGPLAEHRARSQAAWVFTSATLAIGGRFEHYAIKLGLHEPTTLLAPSPFNWSQQALCYLPPGLPEPSSRDYTTSIVEAIKPVLE